MNRSLILLLIAPLLAACMGNVDPVTKDARYDPATGEIELPHPCPDWSSNAIVNYNNYKHSDFGCAVNNDTAVQIADPEDLAHGSSTAPVGPDTEISGHVIELYRAGTIPAPLTPTQTQGTGGGSGGGG